MPYMPYSKKKWKNLKVRCPKCRVEFTTHNPTKMYCSPQCKKAWDERERKKRNAKRSSDTT
jgi:uncharacterized Zn ribbon protein